MLESSHGSSEYEDSFWSFMMLSELLEDFPEEVFGLIKDVLERDCSEDVIGQIAAGPLEDLLVKHGPEIIDLVEEEARTNLKFNHALGGVWQSRCRPDVWARVEAVRKTVWQNHNDEQDEVPQIRPRG